MNKLTQYTLIGATAGAITCTTFNLKEKDFRCSFASPGAKEFCQVWNTKSAVLGGIGKGSLLGGVVGASIFLIPKLKLSPTTFSIGAISVLAIAPIISFPLPKPQKSPQSPVKPVASTTATALRLAIIGQESAGNFKAINPHSGALGYGQVMPYNVPNWTREALGKSLTPNQFLSNKNAQIDVLDYKLNQYFQEGLRETKKEEEAVRFAASKWYSGRGKLKDNTRPQFYNGNRYPSIKSYTESVKRKYKQIKSKKK